MWLFTKLFLFRTPCVGAGVNAHEWETDFPRGGHEVLTALERRSIHQQAQQDILFNQVTEKKQGGLCVCVCVSQLLAFLGGLCFFFSLGL